MAPGITNDKTGAFDTPRTGIAEIDRQTERLQAQDETRIAVGARQAQAEQPTPDAHVGGDVYLDRESL